MGLLRQTIFQHKQGDLVFEAATYDYAKLLLKFGRTAEATKPINRLMWPDAKMSEAEIAHKYKDSYIWTRKARFEILQLQHSTHPEARSLLIQTYQTAKAVFGNYSLSIMHAALLLEWFHGKECCRDTTAATE